MVATTRQTLAEAYPRVASELDVDATGLRAEELTSRASRRVHWRCGLGHRWEASVQQRTSQGQGCPYCGGHRAIPGETSLAVLRPDLLAQWDPDRNELDPDSILPGYTKKVRWRCSAGPDHSWEATPKARTRAGTGCPFCSGHRVSVTNCLAVKFPGVAAELNQDKACRRPPQGRVHQRCNRVIDSPLARDAVGADPQRRRRLHPPGLSAYFHL